MWLRDLEFFITEAAIGMKRSSLMIFITIATVTVSLLIFGVFLLLSANINNLANFIASKLEARVYLKEGLGPTDKQQFQSKLEKIPGVSKVVFVDKETAWKALKEQYANLDMGELVSENPLPDTFKVSIEPNGDIKQIAGTIRTQANYVDEVIYGGTIAERIQTFSRVTKIGGIVLVVLLGCATLLIMVNTIRLTVMARQNEITIMQLVGATNTFIKWPFIIEGLLIGLFGSLISLFILKTSYTAFAVRFQNSFPFFPLVFSSHKLMFIYVFLVVSGTGLGILGAYLSVSRSLKTHP